MALFENRRQREKAYRLFLKRLKHRLKASGIEVVKQAKLNRMLKEGYKKGTEAPGRFIRGRMRVFKKFLHSTGELLASTDPQNVAHALVSGPAAVAEESLRNLFDTLVERAERNVSERFYDLQDLVEETVARKLMKQQAKLGKRYPQAVARAWKDVFFTYGRGGAREMARLEAMRRGSFEPLTYPKSGVVRGYRASGQKLRSRAREQAERAKMLALINGLVNQATSELLRNKKALF